MAEQNLDGKTPVKPIPFDAHERVARHSPQTEADAEPQEYPKAVDHVEHPSGVGLTPVVVNSVKEEREYQKSKAVEAVEQNKAAE